MSSELLEYIEGLRSLDKFRAVSSALGRGEPFHVGGMFGSSPALLLAALSPDTQGTFLVATAGVHWARSALNDFLHFFDRDGAVLFPHWEGGRRDASEGDTETFARRLGVLCRFQGGAPPRVVVAPVHALTQEVVPPEAVRKNTRWIRVGEELDLETFLPWLDSRDLRRVPMAETNGEWSLRGSILDIFPFSSTRPFRVELLGDAVESIREYDPSSQVSVRRLTECRVTLIQRKRFRKPGRGDRPASLLDYLPSGSACVFIETERIQGRVSEIFQRTGEARMPLAWDRFLEDAGNFGRLFLTSLPRDAQEPGVDFTIRSVHRATPGIEGVLDGFRDLVKKKGS